MSIQKKIAVIKDKAAEVIEKADALKDSAAAKGAELLVNAKTGLNELKENYEEAKESRAKEKAFRSIIEELLSTAVGNLKYYSEERTGLVKETADEIMADMTQRIKALKKLELDAFRIDCENIADVISEDNRKKSSMENAADRKLEDSELDKIYKISGKAYYEVMEIVKDYFA